MKIKMSVSTKERYCPVCKRITIAQTCDLGHLKVVSCWGCMTTRIWPVLGPEDRKACMEYATKDSTEGERGLTYRELEYAGPEVRKRFNEKYDALVSAIKAQSRKPIEGYSDDGCKDGGNDNGDGKGDVDAPKRVRIEVKAPAADNEPAPKMSFGQVLDTLKAHPERRFTRAGWSDRDRWISLQNPTPRSKMTEPYIYMRYVQGGSVPWLASQGDLLADDWMEVPQ